MRKSFFLRVISLALVFCLIPSFYISADHDNNVPVKNIIVENMPESMKKGTSVELSIFVSPSNATDKGVYVESSDKNVIYPLGFTLYANSSGTADITLRSADGNVKTTFEVFVFENDGVKFIDVPFINQRVLYPTGCEAVSAVMALQYAGIDISVDMFIENYLPTAPYHIYANRMTYGFSPNDYFSGSPHSNKGCGCYAGAICDGYDALKSEIGDAFLYINLTGSTFEVLEDYIDYDYAILVWGTEKMSEPFYQGAWYLLSYGNDMSILTSKKAFPWYGLEHCLLLVGYDDENYYFNDSLEGKLVSYSKASCEKAFKRQGSQAIAVRKYD